MESASVPPGVPAAEDLPFICPDCGKVYTQSKALGTHRRSAHGVVGMSKSAQRSRAKRLRENTASGVERSKPIFAREAKGRVFEPRQPNGFRELTIEDMISQGQDAEFRFEITTFMPRDAAMALAGKLDVFLAAAGVYSPQLKITMRS